MDPQYHSYYDGYKEQPPRLHSGESEFSGLSDSRTDKILPMTHESDRTRTSLPHNPQWRSTHTSHGHPSGSASQAYHNRLNDLESKLKSLSKTFAAQGIQLSHTKGALTSLSDRIGEVEKRVLESEFENWKPKMDTVSHADSDASFISPEKVILPSKRMRQMVQEIQALQRQVRSCQSANSAHSGSSAPGCGGIILYPLHGSGVRSNPQDDTSAERPSWQSDDNGRGNNAAPAPSVMSGSQYGAHDKRRPEFTVSGYTQGVAPTNCQRAREYELVDEQLESGTAPRFQPTDHFGALYGLPAAFGSRSGGLVEGLDCDSNAQLASIDPDWNSQYHVPGAETGLMPSNPYTDPYPQPSNSGRFLDSTLAGTSAYYANTEWDTIYSPIDNNGQDWLANPHCYPPVERADRTIRNVDHTTSGV